MEAHIINDLHFLSYVAYFAMYKPSGDRYVTQRVETIAAMSDEEAWVHAHAKAKELTKDDKTGDRYQAVELKRLETYHKVTRLLE